MALQLASEEPEGGPWRAEPLAVVIDALVHLAAERATGERGVVLAVDGPQLQRQDRAGGTPEGGGGGLGGGAHR